MRIKHIELTGFKSFLDKTKFEFNVPITTIVGPNGCGKSNVVDAIKWISGELSYKELRGRSMEDLIFAGSDKRPPTSMMEVMLTLDNHAKDAPTQFNEYNEITLQRRIFRDGSSEFYINKVPCRLRDINDIFLDTGMGQSSYSIIEQGKVGLIVSGRPEDRRLMIEEAAGITKYKSRKKAAERKIEYTKQNLLRVSDIVQELKKQIASLERQAKKAEDFRKAQGKVQEVDLIVTGSDYRQLETASKEALQDEVQLQDLLTQYQAELANHESIYETNRIHLEELEKEFQTSQQNLFALRSKIQQITNHIVTSQRDLERLQNEIVEEQTKDGVLDQDITRSTLKIQETKKQIETLEKEQNRLQAEFKEKQAICLEHKSSLESFEENLEQLKTAQVGQMTREAELKSHVEALKNQKLAIDDEILVLKDTAKDLLKSVSEKRDHYLQQKYSLDKSSQMSFTFEENQKLAKEKMQEFESKENELETELSTIQKKLDSNLSKLNALQEFARTYQGYAKSVQGIMKNRDKLGHVHGVLGEMIKPHKGFEKTFQAVLTDIIECVVVDGAEDVTKIVSYLKHDHKTRGVFLTTSDVKSESPKIRDELILGNLTDFVDIQPSVKAAIRNILNNVFIVKGSFEDLHDVWKKHPQYQFVNLEGDYISNHGIIHAGPWSETRGDLEVRRQIDDLKDEIEPIKATRDALVVQLAQLVKSIHFTRHQLETIDTDLEKQSKINLDLSIESEKLLGSIQLLEHKHADVTARYEKQVQATAAIHDSMITFQNQMETIGSEKNRLQEEIAIASDTLRTHRETYQRNLDQSNEFQIQIASMTERLEGLKRDLENTLNLNQYARDEKERNSSELASHKEQVVQLNKDLVLYSEEKETQATELQQRQTANSGLQSRHDVAVTEIRELENKIKTVRTHRETQVASINDTRVKISEFGLRMENLRQQVQEKYTQDLLEYLMNRTESCTAEQIQEYRDELDGLKEKVQKFGNVNLAAIEEVDQLKERFEFLTTQRDDLEQSLQSLIEAIRKINRTTKEKFELTFAEVNERFQAIFPRLFRGGKAKLTLTEPENMLETGVDIFAQPPGKKLQNMNLLSGGEKALTAIALLFAIFEYKAPPFCVLDEVDAPLDDANVLRFVSIVKEMSHKTQFIVITHNKSTMEMAHNLYGVTMEEPGLSKVVSVRLHQDKLATDVEPILEARSAVA